MERIINYRDIPADERSAVLKSLMDIGFMPACGSAKTMRKIMEQSVPDSGPQYYFFFRDHELIGYDFLIGDTEKYQEFPWLAVSNIEKQKGEIYEEMMNLQIAFFEKLGMHEIAVHCEEMMQDYRNGIGRFKECEER